MRLFFAIELPQSVRSALGALRPQEGGAYRWVDPALLHVTLVFLGQQPEQRLGALEQAGAAAAHDAQSGVLKLGEPGSFGPRREPRVLWIGLGGDVGALLALHIRLATHLQVAGFQLEDRPFSPHVTLARRRDGAPSSGPPAWPPAASIEAEPFALDHLTLVESRLSPTYIPLLEFPLPRSV